MKQCLECKKEFDAKSDLAKFCSSLCRQKAYRRNTSELLKQIRASKVVSAKIEKIDGKTMAKVVFEEPEPEKKERKYPLEPKDMVGEMPIRMKGEDAFDFAARKNEWKKSQK